MNLDQMVALGVKLEDALASAGIEVVRPSFRGGNIASFEPIDGPAIITRLMGVAGWIVRERLVTGEGTVALRPDEGRPRLQLLTDDRPVVGPAPRIESRHVLDVNDEDHTDITRGSPPYA